MWHAARGGCHTKEYPQCCLAWAAWRRRFVCLFVSLLDGWLASRLVAETFCFALLDGVVAMVDRRNERALHLAEEARGSGRRMRSIPPRSTCALTHMTTARSPRWSRCMLHFGGRAGGCARAWLVMDRAGVQTLTSICDGLVRIDESVRSPAESQASSHLARDSDMARSFHALDRLAHRTAPHRKACSPLPHTVAWRRSRRLKAGGRSRPSWSSTAARARASTDALPASWWRYRRRVGKCDGGAQPQTGQRRRRKAGWHEWWRGRRESGRRCRLRNGRSLRGCSSRALMRTTRSCNRDSGADFLAARRTLHAALSVVRCMCGRLFCAHRLCFLSLVLPSAPCLLTPSPSLARIGPPGFHTPARAWAGAL